MIKLLKEKHILDGSIWLNVGQNEYILCNFNYITVAKTGSSIKTYIFDVANPIPKE